MVFWIAVSALLFSGSYNASQCPSTVIDNRTIEWNNRDKETLEYVQSRCKVFYPDSPCVKVFIKKKKNTYNVICGRGDVQLKQR